MRPRSLPERARLATRDFELDMRADRRRPAFRALWKPAPLGADVTWEEACRCSERHGETLCTDHGPLQHEDVDLHWMIVSLHESTELIELPETVALLDQIEGGRCSRCGMAWRYHVGVDRRCLLGPTTYRRQPEVSDLLTSLVLRADGQPHDRYRLDIDFHSHVAGYGNYVGVKLPRPEAPKAILYRLGLHRISVEDEETEWGWYPYAALDVAARAETSRLRALGDETEVPVAEPA